VPRRCRSSRRGKRSCTATAARGCCIGMGRDEQLDERRKAKPVALKFLAYIDGAARGNPGPAGAGVYVEPSGERPAEELFEGLGNQTNNVAEYSALLLALTRAA